MSARGVVGAKYVVSSVQILGVVFCMYIVWSCGITWGKVIKVSSKLLPAGVWPGKGKWFLTANAVTPNAVMLECIGAKAFVLRLSNCLWIYR